MSAWGGWNPPSNFTLPKEKVKQEIVFRKGFLDLVSELEALPTWEGNIKLFVRDYKEALKTASNCENLSMILRELFTMVEQAAKISNFIWDSFETYGWGHEEQTRLHTSEVVNKIQQSLERDQVIEDFAERLYIGCRKGR